MPQSVFNHKSDHSGGKTTHRDKNQNNTKYGVISVVHELNETSDIFTFKVIDGEDIANQNYLDKLTGFMEDVKEDCTDGFVQEAAFHGRPMPKLTKVFNNASNFTVTVEVTRNEEENSYEYFVGDLLGDEVISQQHYDDLINLFQQSDSKPKL